MKKANGYSHPPNTADLKTDKKAAVFGGIGGGAPAEKMYFYQYKTVCAWVISSSNARLHNDKIKTKRFH